MAGKPNARLLMKSRIGSIGAVTEEEYEFGDPGQDLQRVNAKYSELLENPETSWFREFKRPEKVARQGIVLWKKGNTLVRKEKYVEALQCYTASVAHTDDDRNRLAYAYEKRGLCFMAMEYYNSAIVEFNRALQLMEESNPSRKTIIIKRRTAQKLVKPRDYIYHEDTPSYGEELQHPEIQSARNCLEICKDDGTRVPGIRAKTFIALGEVVSVERPYAAVINFGEELSIDCNCHHCFELYLNMITCPSCPEARYCSEECREEAFNKYHQFECVINSQLHARRIPMAHALALRTAITGRDEYDEISEEGASSSQSTGSHRSDRLKEIMEMKERSTPGNVESKDYEIAAYVYKILKEHTSFFKSERHENQFKKIYMHLIRIYKSKCFAIAESVTASDGEVSVETLGYGFYYFNTLFDHSCAPNLVRAFYGNAAVLVAVKDILPGDECTIAHGGTYFFDADTKCRRAIMRMAFGSTCNCIACVHNWPTMDEFKDGEGRRNVVLLDLYRLLMRKLEAQPEPEAAKEVMQIVLERFLPATSDAAFYFSYHLTIFCYLLRGNTIPAKYDDEK